MSIKIGNLDVSSFKVGSADCRVYLGDIEVYSGDTPTPHDYSQDYFTMVALGDNFELSWDGKVSGNCLSYSTDNGSTWSEPSSSFLVTLANSGDTIMFKGSGMTSTLNKQIGTLRPTDFAVDYKVQGNIMSLLFGDNFVNQTDLTGYVSAFGAFFQFSKTAPNTRLLSVENLVLPATTLERGCYSNMFIYCTSITTAPELPATTLAVDCYTSMFKGCTSLTTAPELPATTLASTCYSTMFYGCSGLTESPILPAETIKNQSYRGMFMGCTSLSAITCLATTGTNNTLSWVDGVAANGTFTKAASTSSWTTGSDGIPSGWTVVDYSG